MLQQFLFQYTKSNNLLENNFLIILLPNLDLTIFMTENVCFIIAIKTEKSK